MDVFNVTHFSTIWSMSFVFLLRVFQQSFALKWNSRSVPVFQFCNGSDFMSEPAMWHLYKHLCQLSVASHNNTSQTLRFPKKMLLCVGYCHCQIRHKSHKKWKQPQQYIIRQAISLLFRSIFPSFVILLFITHRTSRFDITSVSVNLLLKVSSSSRLSFISPKIFPFPTSRQLSFVQILKKCI